MRYNFKVGDIVRLNTTLLLDSNCDLPYWWLPNNFMILGFVFEDGVQVFDCDKFPLVIVDIYFKNNIVDQDNDNLPSNTVTTQWLLLDIKAQRKMKLKRDLQRVYIF